MSLAMPDSKARSCAHCDRPLAGEFAPHLCGQCGRPQPLNLEAEDFFSALGAPYRFEQDLGGLEARFYALSRALHPDRFAGSGVAVMGLSVERMSFLNQAFTVLRDVDRRSEYLLTLEGAAPKKEKSQTAGIGMPAELAEAWFEIQDAVMEEPESATSKIEAFESELVHKQETATDAIRALERRYDETSDRALFEEISKGLQGRNYLHSLGRDVLRLKYKLQGLPSPWDA